MRRAVALRRSMSKYWEWSGPIAPRPAGRSESSRGCSGLDFDQARAFTVFDDLHMGQGPRNAVAHSGKASAVALLDGTIRLAENLRKQTGITGFTVGEQVQLLTIDQALGCIFKQMLNKRLIAWPLHVRHH